MQKVIVICGPTASGKTGLSIELAKKIDGEIVSCDSMQIYKDMTIGTAKPTVQEMQGIKHYLIDCVSPEQRFSVADYKTEATKAIKEILAKGKVPIVVGGTGLYLEALIYGIEYEEIDVDLDYRAYLDKMEQEKGLQYLYNEAEKIDEEATKKISPNDKKRICRILEIYKATGKTKTQLEQESRSKGPDFDYILFGINMDRDKLYERINKRVDMMVENGLIEEVKALSKKYNKFPTAMQGLGYKEVVEYLNGSIGKDEMIEKIKMMTRRYAKRQLTWFRKYDNITWLDGLKPMEENLKILEMCPKNEKKFVGRPVPKTKKKG